ncbi:MAG: nucleoside triphosphate pyrophosphohydrolase [Patescibacteria group bacterium]
MIKVVKYNKLIRDRIPEIVKKSGWIPKVRVLKKSEFLAAVKKKVLEEAEELMQAKDSEELIGEIVDIQELLDVLSAEVGLTRLAVGGLQLAKRKKRGGFRKRLFLIEEEKI